MKINIPVGTRGTLKKFKKSYQRDFLEKYGYKAYGHLDPFGSFVVLAETVETKYGELVVHGAGAYDAKVHAKTVELQKIFKTLTNK